MVLYFTGEAAIITDWLLLATAWLLVFVRLWLRAFHHRQRLTLSDAFLLTAAVIALAIMIVFQKEHHLGAMHNNVVPSHDIKKMSFATVLLYHTAIYCTKFSILAFYTTLFRPASRGLRISCYVAIAYTASCYLVAVCLVIFWCGPNISRSFETGPGACTVWSYTLFKINFSMNISSDILIFVLPIPLLVTLYLARRQKVALSVTFGLGLITMVVSICRCLALLHDDFVPLYVWSMAEICTAIVVSSLPALRSLLRNSRRPIASTSPSDSYESHVSDDVYKPSFSQQPTTMGSRRSNGGHTKNWSEDSCSDHEIIHVHMSKDEENRFHREVEQKRYTYEHRGLDGSIRVDQTVQHFAVDDRNPSERARGGYV